MESIKFFIDTGDEIYIENIWENFLSKKLTGKEIVGITTNPNAMAKCNIHTLRDFEKRVNTLCKLITKIRRDNNGVVYVQHPNSNVSVDNLRKWIKLIASFGDEHTKVALKIPPYVHLMRIIEEYRNIIDFNVTGVADCSTALLCFTYLPRYVSLIPGRMEEQGVDVISQMKFINQRGNKNSELITGSMRTVEGLQKSIRCNSVPTIGTRVFDILTKNSINNFMDLWKYEDNYEIINFSPPVDKRMTNLSIDFFKQMDEMGNKLNNNLNNND